MNIDENQRTRTSTEINEDPRKSKEINLNQWAGPPWVYHPRHGAPPWGEIPIRKETGKNPNWHKANVWGINETL